MIVEWLLDMIEAVAVFIGGLLPSWDIPSIFGSWSLVTGNLSALNYFLPIGEVFAITLSAFLLFPALMGVSLVVWVVALLRGGSARG